MTSLSGSVAWIIAIVVPRRIKALQLSEYLSFSNDYFSIINATAFCDPIVVTTHQQTVAKKLNILLRIQAVIRKEHLGMWGVTLLKIIRQSK